MSMFKQGYEAVEEEEDRQEKIKANMGKKLFKFFLTEKNPETRLVFLTDEPITYHAHSVKKDGKFYQIPCNDKQFGGDDDCPRCANGEKVSLRGVYLVYDGNGSYVDKQGNEHNYLRLYDMGIRTLGQIQRLQKKYGITKYDWDVSRTGSGTTTTYAFDRGEKFGGFEDSEIKQLLPEKLQSDYDGTKESLYDMVVSQLESMMESSISNDDVEEEVDGTEADEAEVKVPSVNKSGVKKSVHSSILGIGKKPKKGISIKIKK